jgi:hypothetical protein
MGLNIEMFVKWTELAGECPMACLGEYSSHIKSFFSVLLDIGK